MEAHREPHRVQNGIPRPVLCKFTTLRDKLIKIGAKVDGRAGVPQLALSEGAK